MYWSNQMGYTTEFEGFFSISPPLSQEQLQFLQEFSRSRRMKRLMESDASVELRRAVGLPFGINGGNATSGSDPEYTRNSNSPPGSQPGLWCQWTPSSDGTKLEWDKGEKFYNYVEWLEYLITNFMKLWDRSLNGVVSWTGEHIDEDTGKITVIDNSIQVTGTPRGRMYYH
jgi:hypothetical protein